MNNDKNLAETINDVMSEMCDKYCRFPFQCNEEELFKHCDECPLNNLERWAE